MKDDNKSNLSNALRFRYVVLIALTVISTGTIFYHYFMPLKWLDAIYFSVITITTVGYGDIHPNSDITKLFTIFYVLFGVGIIAASLNIIVKIAAQREQQRRSSKRTKKKC